MENMVTIWDVPYEVKEDNGEVKVLDCAGSVLSNLDKPDRICWSKFSCGSVEDDNCNKEWFDIYYDDGVLTAETSFDNLVQWLSENIDAIESIGYECLEHH